MTELAEQALYIYFLTCEPTLVGVYASLSRKEMKGKDDVQKLERMNARIPKK
jgi:hypothetical protein